MKTRPKNKRKPAAETAATIADAARTIGAPHQWIRAASRAIPIRAAGGRIKVDVVRAWISSNREELENPKLSTADQKLFEQVRRLRHQNDREEASLVSLAWVRERFQRFMGEVHSQREKSLADHPLRFREAGGDVAHCRSVLRGTWDEVFRGLQSCSKHFEE